VIAPTCGFYVEQQACATYRHDEDGLDVGSLAAAVRRVHTQRPAPRADPARREQERRSLAAAHRALYARLLR